MRVARTLLALALLGGCGPRMITDARWTFEWGLGGAVVRDVWTDTNATCARSAADEENLRALLHRSHLATCNRHCGRDPAWVACWLRCESAITPRARRCEERQREAPRPPFWIIH